MDTKRATLKFWTLEPLTEESGTRVVVIPFTLLVEGEYPRSFHVRAVRPMTEGPVAIEFPPGQALPVSTDTVRLVANDYYLAALVAAENKTGKRRYVRFVREYSITL